MAVGHQDGRGIPMPGSVLLGGPDEPLDLRLPTVTFTEVEARSRSRVFSMEMALPPVCTVTNLDGRVTELKSRDHRKRQGDDQPTPAFVR